MDSRESNKGDHLSDDTDQREDVSDLPRRRHSGESSSSALEQESDNVGGDEAARHDSLSTERHLKDEQERKSQRSSSFRFRDASSLLRFFALSPSRSEEFERKQGAR